MNESRTLPFAHRLDLRLTLSPMWQAPGDPAIRARANSARWAFATPEGDVALHARVRHSGGTNDERVAEGEPGEGALELTAYGDGSGWALQRAEGLFGLLDDPAAFVTDHPELARLHARLAGLRIMRSYRVVDLLWPVILGQLVKFKEKARAYRMLTHRYGRDAPGPLGLRLPPTPATLAGIPVHEYSQRGVLRRQAETLRFVCRRAKRLERLAPTGASSDEVRAALSPFPGVGSWTIESFLMRGWGDPDAYPVGDYHLPNTVSWFFAQEARGDDARMDELLRPYAPDRGRVVRLLEQGGVHAPRYGPKRGTRPLPR